METEGTQELVNKYLNGNGSRYLVGSISDDEFEVDPLSTKLSMEPSIPINMSPLKSHYENLRGSPIKNQTRVRSRSPKKRGGLQRDLDLSLDEFDLNEDLEPDSHYTYMPSTKYSSLMTTSAVKLRKLLTEEQNKNKHLSGRIKELENTSSRVQALEGDLALIKKELHVVKQERDELQRKYDHLQGTSQEGRLRKENQLLREKLIKYKKLWEEAQTKKRRGPHTDRSVEGGTNMEKEEIKEESRGESREGSRGDLRGDIRGDMRGGSLGGQTEKTDAGSRPGSEDSNGMVQISLETLARILQSGVERARDTKDFPRVDNVEQESDDKEDNSYSEEKEGDEELRRLVRLFHRLSREDADDRESKGKKFKEKERETDWRCKISEEQARQMAHVSEVVDQMAQDLKEVWKTRGVLIEDKEKHEIYKDKEKSECSACTSAASRRSSPPDTAWGDKTRELMGRYQWNRTV